MAIDHRLRVGYLSGPESYLLLITDRCGFAQRRGVELKLVECTGSASLRYHMAHDGFEVALRDSVEAYASNFVAGNSFLQAGALVRGARNHVVVSDQVAGLGGKSLRSLGLLCRSGAITKPLRIAIAESEGSTEFYLKEFTRSVGVKCIEKVLLPADAMEEQLGQGAIDGYCCGLQPTEYASKQRAGCQLEGVNAVPCRREMALAASKQFLKNHRAKYISLLAALCEAQKMLSKPGELDHAVSLIPCENEYGELTVRAAIRDVYGATSKRANTDPGVIGSEMCGGLVAPSPQWDVVTRERFRRLGASQENRKTDVFASGDFLSEVSELQDN